MTEVASTVETKNVSQDSGLWENFSVSNVPANLAAWVELIGEDKVCEKLTQTVMVHSHLVQFRTAACKWLSENSGFARESKTSEDGKTTYTKSEGRYLKDLGDWLEDNDRDPEEFREKLQSIMDSLDFLKSAQTRVRGTGAESKPAKKYVAIAEALGEEGKLEDFLAGQNLSTEGMDDDEIINVAARRIRTIMLEQAKLAEERALAALKG